MPPLRALLAKLRDRDADQFESVRNSLANYARDGETAAQLRARMNRTILEDLEAKELASRVSHPELRDVDEGPSLGDLVAQSRPVPSIAWEGSALRK